MAPTSAPLRRALRGKAPGLRAERGLWEAGADAVAGVDEVGRGSWAGPLTVAAVVADPATRIYKVRDSKMLTPAEREALHDRILAWARAVSVGHATVDECTALGMADAQRLAARRAIDGLSLRLDHVLVDGSWDFVTPPPGAGNDGGDGDGDGDGDGCGPGATTIVRGDALSRVTPANAGTPRPGATTIVRGDALSRVTPANAGTPRPGVTTIVRGDALSLSIAAASVVAKVTRDRIMAAAADQYPSYWFASNKGYPCPRHVAALAAWGPCAIHRRRWVFMEDLRWTGVPRIVPPPDDSQQQLFPSHRLGSPAPAGRR